MIQQQQWVYQRAIEAALICLKANLGKTFYLEWGKTTS